jgi:F420H(2)-dependent quinone reductase
VIPPRLVYRIAWMIHRGLFAATGGRLGVQRPRDGKPGILFVSSIGRKSGQVRRNGVSYLEDGANLVIVASNAGANADPAWWLNLQANPDTSVELGSLRCLVHARAATPDEQARLWPRLLAANPGYDAYRRATSRPLPVVILEPRTA